MIKLQCIKCGRTQNYLENDLADEDKVLKMGCNLCGGSMVLPKKEIPTLLIQDSIVRMEQQIKELGHARVWEIVEGFTYFKTRLSYRKIFLEAGGIIPKTEVKNG